jgi:hypothetical protein
MEKTERMPVVPLEAGAGPDNPPCPACGEPLFGWIDSGPGLSGPVSRCESCGLGVVGGDGDTEEALRELGLLGGTESATIVNRAGFSAWIGGAGWAGLEQGSRYLFTVEAVRRLAATRDQVVKSTRWRPGAGIATMWQTLVNSATFGRNVVVGTSSAAAKSWQRKVDWAVVVVLAIPAFAVALPLELAGAATRRGGALALRFELL